VAQVSEMLAEAEGVSFPFASLRGGVAGTELIADTVKIHGQFLLIQLLHNMVDSTLEPTLKATYAHS
jgi:hypothetical protein